MGTEVLARAAEAACPEAASHAKRCHLGGNSNKEMGGALDGFKCGPKRPHKFQEKTTKNPQARKKTPQENKDNAKKTRKPTRKKAKNPQARKDFGKRRKIMQEHPR